MAGPHRRTGAAPSACKPWIAERAFELELGPAHHSAGGLHNALARIFRAASEKSPLPESIKEEFRAFATKLDVADLAFVPVSALNGDNVVDQWSYYKDGLEVYRDIDANFNRKADQYRWLGTAGIRWALDPNEDGRIDTWEYWEGEQIDRIGEDLDGDGNVDKWIKPKQKS